MPATRCGHRCCFFPYTNSTKPMPAGIIDKKIQVGSSDIHADDTIPRDERRALCAVRLWVQRAGRVAELRRQPDAPVRAIADRVSLYAERKAVPGKRAL